MRTSENRVEWDRDKPRYPSRLTDDEWSHVAPLIRPAKHRGRKREVDVRENVDAIMYAPSAGLASCAQGFAAVWRKTSRTSLATPWRSSASHQSASCSEN
jgi:transposase